MYQPTPPNPQINQSAPIRKHQPKSKKMNDMYIKIHNVSETMHSNQTGHFPATSSRGNQYILVLVEVDGNYVNTEPIKNKTEGSLIKACLALWAQLTASGTVRPVTHILDNKASAAYKVEINKMQISISTTRQSSKKLSRTSNKNLQKSFQGGNCRGKPKPCQ
jgi:hypothetical protein